MSNKRRTYEDKVSAWAAGKAELVKLQREAYEKKVAQDLQLKTDEHKMRMDYERRLYEARLTEVTGNLEFEKKRREIELELLKRKLQ